MNIITACYRQFKITLFTNFMASRYQIIGQLLFQLLSYQLFHIWFLAKGLDVVSLDLSLNSGVS